MTLKGVVQAKLTTQLTIISDAAKMVQAMAEEGITRASLRSLPFGVSLPLYTGLQEVQLDPALLTKSLFLGANGRV